MWGRKEWVLLLIVFLIHLPFTRVVVDTNDGSRMAAVQSVVENGTFVIEDSYFFSTTDKVLINGRFYSDKPPLSYLIAVPLYFAMYHLGLPFTPRGGIAYGLITWLTSGLAVSVMLVLFFQFLSRYKLTTRQRLLYTIALGFGTQLFPYSLTYNNHALGAALIFFAYLAIQRAKTSRQLFLSGLLSGFTAAIDLVAGGIFTVLFAMHVWSRVGTKKAAFFVAGAAAFPVLGLLLNFAISGSVAYFSSTPAYWDYPGSVLNTEAKTIAGAVANTPAEALRYMGPMFFSWKHGFVNLNLILLFGIAGIILALRNKAYRLEASIICVGAACALLYYIFRTGNYGGCGWGFRYPVPLIPLLFLYAPLVFQRCDKWQQPLRMLFFAVLAASIIITAFSVFDPWTCNPGKLIIRAVETFIIPLFTQ
jgi:hypothetical protein